LSRPADETRRSSLEPGDQLGRYTVLSPVGRGGMGEVYAAYDPVLDRRVALKFLKARASDDPGRAQDRLLREAKTMAKLSHPNVVAVHDTGTFDGRVYVAMEYIDGVTLTDWLADGSRSRPEILAVFIAAARGLGAAHDAGLVHRDFKPANVMIARNGAVRVTDFGLARSLSDRADEDGPPSRTDERGDLRLTQTGELLGTPLFMAPEQFATQPIDARADQFSFCVSLYHALYGAGPFGADTLDHLVENVLAGRVEPPPARSSVPAWLRRVVVRGLAVAPMSRWPSMHALIDALERNPERLRRRAGLAVGAVALVGLSIVALARSGPRPSLCLGGPERLAGVWEEAGSAPKLGARRTAVERTFLASDVPGARDVWERVGPLLDRYRASWLTMYREACEATSVHHVQPPALLDLRMGCLEERRLALSALTNILATADQGVMTNAVNAVNALPMLDRCSDRAQLEATVELPRDEATAKRVEDIRRRDATVKALNDTGRHEEAERLAREQLAAARSLGYRPLIAEELVAVTRTWGIGSNFSAANIPLAEEAFRTSLAVRRDDLAAEIATTLTAFFGYYLARPSEGRAWANTADAVLVRLGPGHDLLRAWLLTNEGLIGTNEGTTAEDLARLKEAVAIKERILPADHPDIGASLNTEAEALAALGRVEEALTINRRACDTFVRAYGPTSTEVAMGLNNRAEYLLTLGRYTEAFEPIRQAISNWELHLGRDFDYLGYPLTAEGRALLALARPVDALPPLERALRIREAHESNPRLVAETRFVLARALRAAKAEPRRARDLARRARAAYLSAHDDRHVEEIDDWLGVD
jgi:tetratricopeptide (TPR) repeat protein